jgi:chromosome segregation ATPase
MADQYQPDLQAAVDQRLASNQSQVEIDAPAIKAIVSSLLESPEGVCDFKAHAIAIAGIVVARIKSGNVPGVYINGSPVEAIKRLEDEARHAVQDADTLRAQVEALTKAMDDAETRAAFRAKERDEAHAQVEALTKDCSFLKSQAKEAERIAGAALAERDAAIARAERAEAFCSRCQCADTNKTLQERDALKSALGKAESEREDIRKTLADFLAGPHAATIIRAQEKEKGCDALQDRVLKLEALAEDLAKQKRDLGDLLDAARIRAEKAEQENHSLSVLNAAAYASRDRSDDLVSKTHRMMSEAKRERDAEKDRAFNFCLALTTEQTKHDETKKERDTLKVALLEAIDAVNDLRMEHKAHGHITDSSAKWAIKTEPKLRALLGEKGGEECL